MMVHLSSPKGDISTLEKRGHFYFGLTDLLREAEQNRLLSLAKQANIKPKLASRVLFEIGRRMAILGIRMQARYDSEADSARGFYRPMSNRRIRTMP